jgi:hypothetical protein
LHNSVITIELQEAALTLSPILAPTKILLIMIYQEVLNLEMSNNWMVNFGWLSKIFLQKRGLEEIEYKSL